MNLWLERHRATILVTLTAVVVIGLVFLFLQHRDGRQPLEIRLGEPPVDGQPIEVYVTGAVQHPASTRSTTAPASPTPSTPPAALPPTPTSSLNLARL